MNVVMRNFFLLAMAVLVVACSSTPTGREPAELTDFDAEKRVKKVWSYSVGDGQGNAYYRIAPAIDGDEIFIASSDGRVAALKKSNGKRLWRESYDLRISGGVGVASTALFVGTADGEVVALDRLSGDILWNTTVNGEVLGAPQSNGRVVVVQTYAGQVAGFDIKDGKQLWANNVQVPALSLRGTSSPLLVRDTAIVGLADGRVVAFDINSGNMLWDQRVSAPQGSTEIERLSDVDGRLMLSSDRSQVIATGYQGQVMAINITNGNPRWAKDASSYVGASSGLGYIYVAQADGSVSAFEENGQGVRWTQTVLARRELTAPAVISGTIAVGDFDGYLHFLSQLDGHLMARTRVDSDGLRAPMLVDNGVLYVYSNGGKLVAYKLQDR